MRPASRSLDGDRRFDYRRPARRVGKSRQGRLTVYPIILCGGAGTRLWPLTRPSRPKPLLRLLTDRSLLQDAVLRLTGLTSTPPVIVAHAATAADLGAQLAEIAAEATLLLEPDGRDTAAAVAAACAWVARQDPRATVAILPSDHHVPDGRAFAAAVSAAVQAAEAGDLVVLGVRPASPSTAYGYILPGDALPSGARRVAAFVEKPAPEQAAEHVRAGDLWNSGVLVAHVGTLLAEFELHAPDTLDPACAALTEAETSNGEVRLSTAYLGAPRLSVDYAVLERTTRAAVLPIDFAWSDLGAWGAVWEASPRDSADNAVQGDATLLGAERCLVRAGEGLTVAVAHAQDLVIVADGTDVLVCARDASEAVKTLVARRGAAPPAEPPPLPELAERLRRWLDVQALPLWWALGADHARGGFHDALGMDAQPAALPLRARVQARQVYAYAAAGAAGWPGPWRAAIDHGLSGFESRFRRPDGLFRTRVSPEGEPLDETAAVYDHAFALLAYATVAGALGDPDGALKARALDLLSRMDALRHPAGGFREAGARPFQANCHMHLLEAALAWEAVDAAPAWAVLSDALVDLATTRFFDTAQGAIREVFDADWRFAPGPDGALVEPGHQFEWAWLLHRWAGLRGSEDIGRIVVRLFDAGRRGIDPLRQVAVDQLNGDLTVRAAGAELWPQTEWLKAALALRRALPAEAEAYELQARRAAAAVLRFLDTPTPGLWRDKMTADGAWVEEPAPASSLYHLVCAILELEAETDGGPLAQASRKA